MANPEPVLDEPRKPVPPKHGVTPRVPAGSVFDPNDRFFPRGLLETFEERSPAAPPAPAPAAKARMRGLSIALLALIALAVAAWWSTRWMRGAAPAAAQQTAASPVVSTPIREAPHEASAPPAPPAPGKEFAVPASSHAPSAVVAAHARTMPAVTPVTHTRAAHAPAAPVPLAREEPQGAPAAADPGCAQPIAALGLCGSIDERKAP